MSSRVLRKLQGDKELTEEVVSDPETDIPIGGARRKQFNVNRYDLLNQESHSESEVKEDDNETEANNDADSIDGHDVAKRKKKKKKKKSCKSANNRRSSEDNGEVDEIERTIREVNKLLGENQQVEPVVPNVIPIKKNTLAIQHRYLNPNHELKRIFGSRIVQSEHRRKNRTRSHLKSFWLVSCKDNWPSVTKPGLSMSFENKNGISYFKYEHNSSYQSVQRSFLEAVETLHPDNILAIIHNHPYHVDALIQVSDLCRLSEDLSLAAELIERAIFSLEFAFHPLFNLTQGNCRLEYRRQENRAFYITLFKHLVYVGGRACYRTSLEICKLLLSLEPDEDPLAIVLAIDFYALRAREYAWLIDFADDWESRRNLSQLPNFAFSLAIAHYHLEEDTTVADSLLQNALIMFPGVLRPLLEKCSVHPDTKVFSHKFFGQDMINRQAPALVTLIKLYVSRTYHVWKEGDMMSWLEHNVNVVLKRVDAGEPLVKECEAKRNVRYQGTPRNILRHILLSDLKDVTAPMCDGMEETVMHFDPLPPPDSVNLYTRPTMHLGIPNNSSTLANFFRSLHPSFNTGMGAGAVARRNAELNMEDGARGGQDQNEDSNTINLRRSLIYLVDAMRELLSNVRLPDVPNEADVDENEDSEEDEEQNNYLT